MRPSRKNEIVAAAILELARHGVNGSTVRRIAAEAGVTEGAIYRHFTSKEELCDEAYSQIVAEMADQKRVILESTDSIAAKLRNWVRVTYEYFDLYPEAFSYVLLTAHDFSPALKEISTRQGRLLMKLMEGVVAEGKTSSHSTPVAWTYFTGIMLNIPRSINESILPGPAAHYVDDVMVAVRNIFGLPVHEQIGNSEPIGEPEQIGEPE
jgi:AcrR family transcriptional regulator